MFDTRKFGSNLSRLRRRADMTQSELGDRLNLTRQAISRYELGDSFPDVSILVMMAELFRVSLEELIGAGEPTQGEARILQGVARGERDIPVEQVSDLVGVAPYLKPSVLQALSDKLSPQGIDISALLSLAEYLNSDGMLSLLAHTDAEQIDTALIEKLIPLLDESSKATLFADILEGRRDWHLIRILLPYANYLTSQIEAAVMEGALPYEALALMRQTRQQIQTDKRL